MKWITLAIVSLLSTLASGGEWSMAPTASWDMAPEPAVAEHSFAMTPDVPVKPATLTRIVEPPKPAARQSYPTRGGHWTVDGYSRPNRQFLISHLLSGQHAGKFSRPWLDSLSYEELLSLHDDDHEGRYRGQIVRAASTQRVYRTLPSCPNGRCPLR